MNHRVPILLVLGGCGIGCLISHPLLGLGGGLLAAALTACWAWQI